MPTEGRGDSKHFLCISPFNTHNSLRKEIDIISYILQMRKLRQLICNLPRVKGNWRGISRNVVPSYLNSCKGRKRNRLLIPKECLNIYISFLCLFPEQSVAEYWGHALVLGGWEDASGSSISILPSNLYRSFLRQAVETCWLTLPVKCL